MNFSDLFITPIFIVITYVLALLYRSRIKNIELRKYFIPGLTVKIVGSVATGLIYFFYYGDGDTVYFFKRALLIQEVFSDNFTTGLKLLFNNPRVYDYETSGYFSSLNARDVSSLAVSRIAAVFGFFCFSTYSSIALFFSNLSFVGLWKMFTVFARIYPDKVKYLAVSCLFIPSVFFWGSGLFKDTVTMGALAWMTALIFNIFMEKKYSVFNFLQLAICVNLIGVIKSYILLAFLPAAILWVIMYYRAGIKSKAMNIILTPILIAMIGGGASVIVDQLGSVYGKFSIDNIQEKAEGMQRWHLAVEEIYEVEGSSYSLGTPVGAGPAAIIASIPAAVNVTLFRPYIWEVENPMMLLAFAESFIFFMLTLRLLFINKITGFFSKIFADPTLLFCFIFAMIFAFSVGFTSYNFGALVRYKIPCLPFYGILLSVLYPTANAYSFNERALKRQQLKMG